MSRSGGFALAFATAIPSFAQPPATLEEGNTAEVLSTPRGEPALLDADKIFRSYRSYVDQEVTSWRKANDEVGRIGGWQAYAREAQTAGEVDAAKGSSSPAEGPSVGNGTQNRP